MTLDERVNRQAFTEDLRAGLIDSELMEKYQLTAVELRGVLEELLVAREIHVKDVHHRPVFWDDAVDKEPRRRLPRLLVAFVLRIHEEETPDVKGSIVDLTDEGMRVRGLSANTGDKKRYVVLPRRFTHFAQFSFEAECLWRKDNEARSQPEIGLHITSISPQDLKELRNLIRCMTLGVCPDHPSPANPATTGEYQRLE